MLTIGNFLRRERVSSKTSLEELERKTRIRKEILELIETERWDKLPEYPVVLGFVKNISKALKVDINKSVALLRRDYPPKVISLKRQITPPSLDAKKRLIWNPKTTFVSLSVLVFVLVLFYIFYQLKLFLTPPFLEVYSPQENQTLSDKEIELRGKASKQSTVEVNGVYVELSRDGSFVIKLSLKEGEQVISVKARSRSGKTTEVNRKVFVIWE